LPSRNPQLNSQITIGLPGWVQRGSAMLSVLSMGALIVVQLFQDIKTLQVQSLSDRISHHSLTSLELVVVWSTIGAILYLLARRRE